MTKLPRLVTTAAASVLTLAFPLVVHACSVCNLFGNERNRKAFFDTTIFLSLLPLGLMAVGCVWIARRGGDAMRDEFVDRDVPVAPVANERA